jgi:cytochrome P460
MYALLFVCLLWFQQYASSPQSQGVGRQETAKATGSAASANETQPQYTQDGKLVFPADYRLWAYVTSGVDMDYNPSPQAQGHTMFDNVFVNPQSYQSFLKTGTWPDKTLFVLEARVGASKGSINKGGHYQSTETMGHVVHVKDSARFAETNGWAFFGFDDDKPGEPGNLFPKGATCYSCHEQHGAVDTTFVQFYPTLLPVAREKKTFSSAYLKDEGAAK